MSLYLSILDPLLKKSFKSPLIFIISSLLGAKLNALQKSFLTSKEFEDCKGELQKKIKTQSEITKNRQKNDYHYINIKTEKLQKELWKTHYQGKYQVSNLGRMRLGKEILEQTEIRSGYLILKDDKSLSGIKLNNSKYIYIHLLLKLG